MTMSKWRILVLALLVTICLNGYVLAANSSNFNERPTAFEPGKNLGYFLWQDKERLHLRITSTGTTHIFSGTIRTDGRFKDVLGKYKAGNEDYLNVSNSQNKITYHFTVAKEEEGVDFLLSYGSYIKFDLSLDGNPINTQEIFIGKEGWHPARNSFTLRNDEDYINYSDDRIIYIIDGGLWYCGWHGGHRPRPGHPG
jgi:hypothetical protein